MMVASHRLLRLQRRRAHRMTPHPERNTAQSRTHQVTPQDRRVFFQTLAKLDGWQVALPQALPIAGQATRNSTLTSHALALLRHLEQGRSLGEAFESDQHFWGRRTVQLIREMGNGQAKDTYHQLAAGAAEHPMQRPAISCFGMGWRRRIISITALCAIPGIFLPLLPHFKGDDGLLIVLPFPQYPYIASLENPYETLDSQWKRYWEIVRFNENALSSMGDLRPIAKKVSSELGSPSLIGDYARYFQKLSQTIRDPQSVACYIEARKRLFQMSSTLELLTSLNQLVVSPVPAVWLLRAQQVSTVRKSLDLIPGEARQSLVQLQKHCPAIKTASNIPQKD